MRLRLPSASASGEELRAARISCGYDVAAVARELGVPPGHVRALEWGRADLLGERRAARLERSYLEWLAPDGIPRPVRSNGL